MVHFIIILQHGERICGTNARDKCLGHVYDSSPKSDWCLGGSIKGESKTGSWEEKKRHSVNTEELKNTIIVKDQRMTVKE